jgi:YD repeat-containing protein
MTTSMTSKTKLLSSATAALLLTSQTSQALTNMRDASFSHSETDFTQTSLHEEFQVKRYYNSRSDRDGAIGYGWCLSLEKRLRTTASGKLALFECGTSDEIIYKRNPERADQWLAENAASDSLITLPNGTLLRRTARGTVERYGESSGRFIGSTDSSGRALGLSYDREERLQTVTAENGAVLRFSYNGKKISNVTGQLSIAYHYKGQDLKSTEINGRSRDQYNYDDLHNLTQIKKNSRNIASVEYDAKEDRIASMTGADGCRETYSYTPSKDPSDFHFTSEARRMCLGVKPVTAKFEFWFAKSLGKDARYLARMRVSSEHGSTEITFHPDLGRPLEMNRNGVITRFQYESRDSQPRLSLTKR